MCFIKIIFPSNFPYLKNSHMTFNQIKNKIKTLTCMPHVYYFSYDLNFFFQVWFLYNTITLLKHLLVLHNFLFNSPPLKYNFFYIKENSLFFLISLDFLCCHFVLWLFFFIFTFAFLTKTSIPTLFILFSYIFILKNLKILNTFDWNTLLF